MASADDYVVPDEPIRFRLRTIFVGVAVVAVALAMVRGCPCVPESRLYNVRIGMTEAEVLGVMGRPPWKEGWSYDRNAGHMIWIAPGLDSLIVEFEDGRVSATHVHD